MNSINNDAPMHLLGSPRGKQIPDPDDILEEKSQEIEELVKERNEEEELESNDELKGNIYFGI